MSETLPQGFNLVETAEENKAPPLPAGFSVVEQAKEKKPKQPFTERLVDAAFKTPTVQSIAKVFGENSEIGKLSPEQQMKWIEKEAKKANNMLKAATRKYEKLLEQGAPKDGFGLSQNKTGISNLDRYNAQLEAEKGRAEQARSRLEKVGRVLEGTEEGPTKNAVMNATSGGLKAFANAFGEALPKAAGAIQSTITGQEPSETAPYRAGQRFADNADQILATDSARSETTTQQVAEGLGQAASFLTPGAPLKALGVGGKGRAVVMAGMGATQGGVAGLDEAIQFGGDAKQQLTSFYANSALGLSEAVPLSRFLNRLNKSTGGKVERIIKNSTANGLEEAMQEVGQTIGSNFIADELAKYDEGRAMLEGTKDAAKIGGIIGALLGGGGAAITRGTQSETAPQSEEVSQPVQPEENTDREPIQEIKAAVIREADAYVPTGGKPTKTKYAIVEASDLITSHDNDLNPNPSYPQILQPRDRSRAASQTQVNDMASNLNPAQLGETPDAGSGAPVISNNGIVESGNGRSLALKRVYTTMPEKAQQYREWLEAQGYPTDGFNAPVLVRIADPNRTDGERVSFARAANARATADMSVTERSIADSKELKPQDFDLAKRGGIEEAKNRDFARSLISRIATESEMGSLIDSRGVLSVDGKRRLDAAIAAYAYEDPRVVSDLLETTDNTLKSIGKVLVDVAPEWAKLRAAIESDLVDPRANILPNVIEAANIIRDAREAGQTVEERLDILKNDMFSKTDTSQKTRDVLEMFYDPETMRQRKPAIIAAELSYFVQEAQKAKASPGLFAEENDIDPSDRIFNRISAMRAAGQQFTQDEDFDGTKSEPIKTQSNVDGLPEGFTVKGSPRNPNARQQISFKVEGITNPDKNLNVELAKQIKKEAEKQAFAELPNRPAVIGFSGSNRMTLDTNGKAPSGNIDFEVYRTAYDANYSEQTAEAKKWDEKLQRLIEKKTEELSKDETFVDGLKDEILAQGAQWDFTEVNEDQLDSAVKAMKDQGRSVRVQANISQYVSAEDAKRMASAAKDGERIFYDEGPSELPEGMKVLKSEASPAPRRPQRQPQEPKPKPKNLGRGRRARVAQKTPEGQTVGDRTDIKGLHEITTKISNRFKAIARQGRMGNKSKKVRGFYRPKDGVIRLRKSFMEEIDTFAHEVGHHFEFDNDASLRNIMERHHVELNAMDYMPNRKDREVATSEGFAEYFSAYITNPTYAKKKAPKFTKDFERWIDDKHPGLKEDIQEFNRQYEDWLNAPSAASVASNIVEHPKAGYIAEQKQKLKNMTVKEYADVVTAELTTAFVDSLKPMERVVAEMERLYQKNRGKPLDLKAIDDPYKILRMTPDAQGAAITDMREGVLDRETGERESASFSEALEVAMGSDKSWTPKRAQDFDAYLVSRRAVQEWERYEKGEIRNPPTKNSRADHYTSIEEYEAARPEFKRAAELLYDYNKAVWKKKYDAGLIKKETYEETLKRPDYVPFKRDISDLKGIKKIINGVAKMGNNKGAGIVQRFDGSGRPILSPTQSIIEDSVRTARTIARNDAMQALKRLAQNAGRGSGRLVEILPKTEIKAQQVDAIEILKNRMKDSDLNKDEQKLIVDEITDLWDGDGIINMFRAVEAGERGENIVYVWEKGERIPMLIGDPEYAMDIYGMMMGVEKDVQSAIVDAMAIGTTALRTGITHHPMFTVTNVVRDQLSTWVQSNANYIPFLDAGRGFMSLLKQDENYAAYNSAMGISGGIVSSGLKGNGVDKDLDRLRKKGMHIRRLKSREGFSMLSDWSETMTRLGLFAKYVKKYKKEGMTDKEAFAEAAYEVRDVMDFSLHGTKMTHPRRLVPFLNAQLQGLYKTKRTLAPGGLTKTIKPYLDYKLKGEPKTLNKKQIRQIEMGAKAWAKVSAIGMIGLGIAAAFDDDPEYAEFNDYYRSTHWITKMGDEWILIPKPFELATMSNLFEAAYADLKLKDKTAFKRFRKSLREMLVPPASIPVVSVPIEQITNYQFFNSAPIVPRGTEGAGLEYMQYSAGTSLFARKLGRALDWSPARIDHALKGFGGTLGRDALRLSDAASGEKAALSLSNTPVASRLVKNPDYGSRSLSKMFDLVGESGTWDNRATGFKKALKAEDEKEAAFIMGKMESFEEKVFAMANAGGSNKKEVALKRMHPMRRAKDASEVLRKARKEISFDSFEAKMTREQRRDFGDTLAKLDATISRNGLKYSKEKGWAQMKHTPEAPIYAKLKEISPEGYKVIKARLAKKKMTPEGQINKRFEQLQRAMRPKISKIEAQSSP